MDFQRFGIDPRLWGASEGLRARAYFHEKMLSHVLEKNENVCARLILSEGREEVYLLPVFQALLSAQPNAAVKALVVVSDPEGARAAEAAARLLGKDVGIGTCLVMEAGGVDEAPGAPSLEGDPSAPLVIGLPQPLLAAAEAGVLRLRDYLWLVADGLERLAELPGDVLRRLQGLLLPSWERRSLLVCHKLTVKAKNLAWDWADNPSEIQIEEAVVKAQSIQRESWHVPVEAKFKFLLNLIKQEKPDKLCVFCNLRSTAEEVARRLEANGQRSDYILGALAQERKTAILDRVRSGDLSVLVLTDEGAQGLAPGVFSHVINYDIPLEPEFFVKRLEMIDRGSASAKVLNMVCDRYVYGLTAVEQYIDAKLDALPAEPSQYEAVDLSEGMSFGPPGRSSDQGRSELRASRPAEPRADRRREGGSRVESRGRPEGRAQAGRARDDRSPDIRRSIAEATGGSMDIDGIETGQRRNTAERQPMHRGRGDHRSRAQNEGRRPHDGENGPRRRDEESRAGNPYDLPMEERMKRYREKYGGRLGGERPDAPRPAPGTGRRNQANRAASRHEDGRPGAQAKRSSDSRLHDDARRAGGRDQQREERARRQTNSGGSRGAPREGLSKADPRSRGAENPSGEDRRDGLFGRLQGFLRRRGR